MRKTCVAVLAGAAALALSRPAGASIVYLQNFSASAGMAPITAVNWNAYYGSATAPATVATAGSSGNPANAMLSGGPSAPTPGPNVNATYTVSSTADGFVPLLSDDGADQFVVYTNEYTIDPSAVAPTFSWYAASGYTGDLQRLIVQIGGNWYASTSPISPPSGVIQGTSFAAGSAQFTADFSTAASAWDTLNFSPGSDLTLGPALSSPLPGGDITGFGIYAQIADNNKGNERTFLDTYEVDASPVPEPAGMALLVCVTGVLMRPPKGGTVTLGRWAILLLLLAMPPAIWVHLKAVAADQASVLPIETSSGSANLPPSTQPTIRCAVIGGMFFTGFWSALADRYEKETGIRVAMVVTGPKNDLVKVFKQGHVDLITMHSSDAIVNLVADGYAMNPQPWMRNDLMIVGPPDDPAGIKGMTDAVQALKKIADSKSPFVVHSSLGAQEVLLNILEPNEIQLDPAKTTVLFDDQQRSVLKVAGEKHAYTLVGRIPFHTGRLPNDGLVAMVRGDPRLRRPYLVAVTNPKWMPDVNVKEATRFAAYLRSPQTQAWIAQFGKGSLDDQPIFFPVNVNQPN